MEPMTLAQLEQALKAPFPAAVVNWKPQAVSKDKTRALAVAYIDARDVANRLDTVLGAFGWQLDHKSVADKDAAGIGIKHPETNEWIWKFDIGFVSGEESNDADAQTKGVKGTASDSFKRAAALWGIGRYLYDLPKVWVEFDADKRALKTIPPLPTWALPEGDKGQKPAAAVAPVSSSMTAVQRANLIGLYEKLYFVSGADAVKGLDELFRKEFEHGGKDATPAEATMLERKLTTELNAKTKTANRTPARPGATSARK